MLELPLAQLGPGIDATTAAASEAVSQQVAASEWLGPLTPIALSPFFGLALLSGMATYGPEWLQQQNALLGQGSSLNNPALFWTMALMALFTSLPRLSKVSKPIVLAAENLEAYSAVIIFVVIRFWGSAASADADPTVTAAITEHPTLVAAGIADVPLDLAMSIVAALNIIVVNGVKLFFEFLIWIVPFPSVDAILEVGNKFTCAGLMAIYVMSPTIATIINLIVLACCLLVFGWTYRRITYYREMIAGPVLAWLIPGWFRQRGSAFRAFTTGRLDGLPSLTAVKILPGNSDGTFTVRGRWLWRSLHLELEQYKSIDEQGVLASTFVLTGPNSSEYCFEHRRWVTNDDLYEAAAPRAAPA